VEHVGVGSDLDLEGFGQPRLPPGRAGIEAQRNFERYRAFFAPDGGVHVDGLNHSRRVLDLTDALIRRGFSDDAIRLMLGGNFARVLADLWA